MAPQVQYSYGGFAGLAGLTGTVPASHRPASWKPSPTTIILRPTSSSCAHCRGSWKRRTTMARGAREHTRMWRRWRWCGHCVVWDGLYSCKIPVFVTIEV